MTTDRELVKNWDELTLKDLASIIPQEFVENFNTRTLAEQLKILAKALPQEFVEKWDELSPVEKLRILAKIPPISRSTITRNQVETTIRLLKEKASIEYISQVTGLTKEQINGFKGC